MYFPQSIISLFNFRICGYLMITDCQNRIYCTSDTPPPSLHKLLYLMYLGILHQVLKYSGIQVLNYSGTQLLRNQVP